MSDWPCFLTVAGVEAAFRALIESNHDLEKAVSSLKEDSPLRGIVAKNLDATSGLLILLKSIDAPSNSAEDFYAEILLRWVEETSPRWRRHSIKGRSAALEKMPLDERQIVRYAGLLESDSRAQSWWDRVSNLARFDRDAELLEIGRQAEHWSYLNELKTPLPPEYVKWISLEDNTAGFDIFSQLESGAQRRLEVKYIGKSNRFFLTRNEWDTALAFYDTWILQLWKNHDSYIEVTPLELRDMLPADTPSSRWTEVELEIPQ